MKPKGFRWRLPLLDALPLALARIGIGGCLLADLGIRASDWRAHYSSAGVLPWASFRLQQWDFLWSLHGVSDAAAFHIALWTVGGLATLALTVGFRTPWATGICWLFFTSLHGQNPLLRDGQDDWARVVLFWSCFLPWGEAFSLDALWQKQPPRWQLEIRNVSNTCWRSQIACVYFASALFKVMSPWWQRGEALSLTLSLSRYETAAGQWLLQWPSLLRTASVGAVVWEMAGALLLFAPASAKRIRKATVLLFCAFHGAMGCVLQLGIFPWITAFTWISFWPANASSPVPASGRLLRRNSFDLARAAAIAAAGALGLALWLNIESIGETRRASWANNLGRVLGLQQWWGVFAPRRDADARFDGYQVLAGKLEDGSEVDAFRGGALTFARPPLVSNAYPNRRWRHYLANVTLSPIPPHTLQFETVKKSRQFFLKWLCEKWNRSPSTRLRQVDFYLMRYPLGQRVPVTRVHLGEHDCANP